MKTYRFIFSIILLQILVISCKREAVDPPTYIWEEDSLYECNAFKIYHDDFYTFNLTDSMQFGYKGLDTLKFIRNTKDTFIFTGGEKLRGRKKFPMCSYYFNHWDTSALTFTCTNWTYPIIILQQVVPKGDGVFLPYYGYFEHNSEARHTFSTSFNKLVFNVDATPIPSGGSLAIPSATLLTYKVILEPGIIKKFVLQGGETWDLIP